MQDEKAVKGVPLGSKDVYIGEALNFLKNDDVNDSREKSKGKSKMGFDGNVRDGAKASKQAVDLIDDVKKDIELNYARGQEHMAALQEWQMKLKLRKAMNTFQMYPEVASLLLFMQAVNIDKTLSDKKVSNIANSKEVGGKFAVLQKKCLPLLTKYAKAEKKLRDRDVDKSKATLDDMVEAYSMRRDHFMFKKCVVENTCRAEIDKVYNCFEANKDEYKRGIDPKACKTFKENVVLCGADLSSKMFRAAERDSWR